jgi:type II restriction enzyme
MKDSIADWKYYTNFEGVYEKVDKIKISLNIINSLIGSKNIKDDFLYLLKEYPEILKVIPILIAKRVDEIVKIKDFEDEYYFDFKMKNYTNEEYAIFMEKTGLFDLLSNHLIASVYDYVTGVEVGMDTNARKNRTGQIMENIVQKYFEDCGFKLNESLFKEMRNHEIEKEFNLDLSNVTNNGETVKRFDFVAKKNNKIYLIEVNFYSGGGSKLNETARSYKMIATETKEIDNVEFIWITDGIGWKTAKNNLKETFEIMEHIYNLNDLKNGVLNKLNNNL